MPPPRPDAVDESEITSDVEASMPRGWATLLPWLELRGAVSFGGLRFEHLSSLASRLCVDDRETLELLAKTFGPGVDPVVSWALEGGATPTFTAPDSDAVRHRVRLLAVAAIVANDYFQPFPASSSTAGCSSWEPPSRRPTPWPPTAGAWRVWPGASPPTPRWLCCTSPFVVVAVL
jgi:hypothetical protein